MFQRCIATLGGGPMILEGFVAFEREASVIAARSLEGAVAAFDLCENEHERHILARTHVPAQVGPGVEAAARALAAQILEALDYVGVIGVELFVAREADGAERCIVNELAPRVHNSGHWTIEGAQTSQFEQHIRAIAGWPLGDADRRGRIEMHNLIGDEGRRMARHSRPARAVASSLRQAGNPARPQDGPCDPRVPGAAAKRLIGWTCAAPFC